MPTLFWFSPWQPPADSASGAITCTFLRGGIPSPPCRKYHSPFCVIFYGANNAIISLSYHNIFLPLTLFACLCRPEYPPRLHLLEPSPSSRNIYCLPSPSYPFPHLYLKIKYLVRRQLTDSHHYPNSALIPPNPPPTTRMQRFPG